MASSFYTVAQGSLDALRPRTVASPTVSGEYIRPARSPAPASTPQAPAPPPAPGVLDAPGVGEQYYATNQQKWAQPTKSSTYYGDTKGYYTSPAPTPTSTTSAYSKYMKEMSDPGRGTERAWDISDQLGTATQGEQDLRALGGQLGAPGAAEDYYAGTKDFYGTTGMGEERIQGQLGEFDAPGVSELNYDDINSDYGHFVGDLRGPSASEDLYNSGKGEDGLTTYYAREREKSQRALDDAMAARGLFGGEASLRGSIELNSDIAAQQAKAMAEMAAQSDAAKLARTAGAREYGSLKTNAADLAQTQKFDRVQGGIDNAVTGQGLEAGRIKAGQTSANEVQDRTLGRVSGAGTIAGKLADTEISRLMNSGTLGLSGDTEDRTRLNDLLDSGLDVDRLGLEFDKFGLDKIEKGRGAASDADAMDLSFLTSGMSAATTAQNSFENRERNALNDIAGVTGSMTGDYKDQANQAVVEWLASEEQKIQAMLDAGQISHEGANARRQENQRQSAEFTKLILEGALGAMGGSGGAGAGGGQ